MDALKIIPQIFFDLIARIVPGILALILAAFLLEDSWKDFLLMKIAPFSTKEAGSISTMLLLVASYIIGHLISPLTKIIQGLWKKEKKKGFDSRKYEWLRVHQTDVGAHCAKLRAEFTMYNSFSAVFLIFFCLEMGEGFVDGCNHFIIAIILALLSYFIQARGKEGEETFQNSVNNFYWAANGPLEINNKDDSIAAA